MFTCGDGGCCCCFIRHCCWCKFQGASPANFATMARTRIDPWLTDQPDAIWRQSTLASIIPDLPCFSTSDSQNKTPKMMKVLLPNPLAKSQQSGTINWSDSESKPIHHRSPPRLKQPFQETHLSSSNSSLRKKHKHKNKLKRRHRSNDEFEAAASKVLAALNMSRINPENHDYDDLECELKPKKVKTLSLPDGDRRKNMVPKVVLKDIGSLISKVCPKLSSGGEESHSETSGGSSPASPAKSPAGPPPVKLNKPPVPMLDGKGPANLLAMSPTKITKALNTAMSKEMGSRVLANSEKSRVCAMSPTKITKGINTAMSSEKRNESLASSEKSFAPFSEKETTFAALASASPSFSNSPIASPTSFSWQSSSKLLPSIPVESGSSKLASNFPSLLSSSSELDDKAKTSDRVNSQHSKSSLKPSRSDENSAVPPATRSSRRVGLSTTDALSKCTTSDSQKSKPPIQIKNGFVGFAQEDGKKLRVCFHVNTNILASSLDLLDLHKNSEVPSGSPSTCPHCNVTFSSVKHCKYHQSFSANVSLAPSRHNNIQENDLWLCPWCPLMATSVRLLNSHKSVCREKGRCQQEEKASSVRKNAPISSSQRNSPKSSTTNGTFTSPSKFKVVHGHVIQL